MKKSTNGIGLSSVMNLFKHNGSIRLGLLLSFVLLISTSCLKQGRQAVTDQDLPECANNSATTESCKISTISTIVTTTLGSNVTFFTNPSASTTVTGSIPTGYYQTRTCSFTDSDLIAANIKKGVSIFLVTGTRAVPASNAHRSGTTQLELEDEATGNSGTRLTAIAGYSYRTVPNMATDDEGTSETNVTHVNRTGWAVTVGASCGTAGSISARITDCETKYQSQGSGNKWTGVTLGNAGQGGWTMVTRSCDGSACKEVWRDDQTELLWSSRVSSDINWCKATGANSGAGFGTSTDASNLCDNATHQTTPPASACVEHADLDSTSDMAIDPSGKAGLTLSSTPNVEWRVPTIYDWQLANVHGIRFVFADMGNAYGTTEPEWSSTIDSTNHTRAWTFDVFAGAVSASTRNTATIGARCIGRAF